MMRTGRFGKPDCATAAKSVSAAAEAARSPAVAARTRSKIVAVTDVILIPEQALADLPLSVADWKDGR
jgi:hypothetical protein